MKRFFLLLLAAITVAGTTSAEAQTPRTKYQGEVYIAGGYGVGDVALHRLQLHTIHGARVGQCFSAGVGVGLDWHTPDIESGLAMIPIFADIKLYAPTRSKFDPFIMFDIGYSLSPEEPRLGGMMLNAGLGFKAGAFAMSLGYSLQQLGSSGIRINMNAIQLKLGVAF